MNTVRTLNLKEVLLPLAPSSIPPPRHAVGAHPNKKSCVWHTVWPDWSSPNPRPAALYLEERVEAGDAAGDGLHGAGLCRLPGTAFKLQHPVSAAARTQRRGPAAPLPSAPAPRARPLPALAARPRPRPRFPAAPV